MVNVELFQGKGMTAVRLTRNDKLVMIGDSITDCGRKQPVGEGLNDALGRGYVAQVNALLNAVYPHLAVRVVNMGTSGHTVRDLKERWERDLLDLQPDWVSVKIGINDVWRQFDLPTMKEAHVYIDEYEATLTDLVQRTRPRVKGMVLLTPYYLEPNRSDSMRAAMDRYGAVVRRVAAENDSILVDTQAAFDQVLEHLYPGTLAWDRVHPNQSGHMTIARAFLNAIGFAWNG
jgi:lysophospholipase L1-like esterase